MKEKYDVVIIGSGLGGLVSANILAREGYSVCVLEKNNQFGGNLQTFVRDKSIFDTGVHYIGGLDKGDNLYKYFTYLGIMKDLKIKKMNLEYDKITFDNDETEYAHTQGFDNFKINLLKQFPDEEKAIDTYLQKIIDTCNSFPLYNLKTGKSYYENSELLSLNTRDYIHSITTNEKLRAVLVGSNLLYAGSGDKTPFYVHALSVGSYMHSSYRCINGGGQIAKLLIRRLKEHNGEFYKYQEVTSLNYEVDKLVSVSTKKGDTIKADIFISNIEPINALNMIKGGTVRKSYIKRIEKIESVISAFCLYIVFKPESFKYLNYNYYHFKDTSKVWTSQDYSSDTWPESYMISFSTKKQTDKWAENMTAIAYMNFNDVKEWEQTFNTVANENDRGKEYEAFKKEKAEKMLVEVEKKFPNIRKAIQSIHTSTPLSYRDYIGVKRGSMYGYVKDANNPLRAFLSPKTKIKNLFLTGQNLNMHGILGVTISGVVTCSEILGREYLINKINDANKE